MKLALRAFLLTLVASSALADRESPFETSPSSTAVFSQSIKMLEVANFNGDGLVDLVVVTSGDNRLYVLLGKTGGELGDAKEIALPRNYLVGSIQLGDANGDGHLDIVTGNRTDIVAFLGDGRGGFTTQYSYRVGTFDRLDRMDATLLGLGDLNGDGRDDVIAIGHPKQPAIAVSLANEDGTYQQPVHFTAERPFASYPGFTVADINHDGYPDVVAAESSWLVAYTGNGDGTLNREVGIQRLSNTGYPIRIRNGDNGKLSTIDSDSDGMPDRLRLLNRSSLFEFSIEQEGPLFTEASAWYYSVPGYPPAPADLDGDGLIDLTQGYSVPDRSSLYTPNTAIAWGEPAGKKVAMPPILHQVPTGLTQIVDVDGDGRLDAVVGIKYPSESVETKFTDTGPGFIHVFRGRIENAPDPDSGPKKSPAQVTTRSTETIVAAPSPASAEPVAAATTPQSAGTQTEVDDLVGCWRWSNGATITVSATGKADNGMSEGDWEQLENRKYEIKWPDIVSSVTLDATGASMTEKTMFSSGSGSRVGAPSTSFEGTWQLNNGATAVAASDGSYTIAHLEGSWRKAAGERQFEILWPLTDAIVLNPNGRTLSGSNQFGRFNASKAASCAD